MKWPFLGAILLLAFDDGYSLDLWEKKHPILEAIVYGVITSFILLFLWWFYESAKRILSTSFYSQDTPSEKRWRIVKVLFILGGFWIGITFFGENVGRNLICEHNRIAACLIGFLVTGGVIVLGMSEGIKESEINLEIEILKTRITDLEIGQIKEQESKDLL